MSITDNLFQQILVFNIYVTIVEHFKLLKTYQIYIA